MIIDTNELRRLAQEAMHPVTKGRWMRLFGERTVYDRMEDGCRGIPVVSTPFSPPHPFEAACLDFIADANPAAVTELLDRLEAAESARRDDYQNWMTALDRNAELLAKLEAAEKELVELRLVISKQQSLTDAAQQLAEAAQRRADKLKTKGEVAEKERDAAELMSLALRAKIDQIERQEPK